MFKINYNPDVLSCLANLSSDEVFTSPSLVNDMLDMLPKELWSDKKATFLDPVSKSGVFLREIAKRLTEGLEDEIPDLQERTNHIFKNQLYGIAITELTSLLSRRSVYCSKTADGKYSICEAFDDEQGNILFERIEHTWKNEKCRWCGASKSEYDRDEALETHAYQFIHTDNPKELFDMRFDVIVGNPPYQLSDGGHGTSAKPIYHKFVEQAKKLNPRYLTMIIPARWYSGGKGLCNFRKETLSDKRITKLIDYFDSNECFPGVDISGGVCYFLWERDNSTQNCEVKTIRNGETSQMTRPLLEENSDIFIRFNEAIKILRKVQSKNEDGFVKYVSPRKPFGLSTNTKVKKSKDAESIKIYSYPDNGYIKRNKIERNKSWIDKDKVYISYAYGERGAFPYLVLGKPFIGEKKTCCTETYLVIGPFNSKKECENVISYIKTRFFRFLVLLKKNTQHATSKVYHFVPTQDFSEEWTDKDLFKKYGFTNDEINFIESMVRPMEFNNE